MAGERTLPGLGLTAEWTQGTGGWKAGMDANLLKLSALSHISVISATTALPGNAADGAMYIVPAGASSHPNEIALRDKGGWIYFTPLRGMRAHIQSSDTFFFYNGTDWLTETTTLEVAKDDVTFNEVVGRLNFTGNGVVLEEGGTPDDVIVRIERPETFAELPQVDFDPPPSDGQLLGWDGVRQMVVAVDPPTGGGEGGGIEEAPINGKLYGRKDGGWSEVPQSGGGSSAGLPNPSGTGETRTLVVPTLSLFGAPINGSDTTFKDIAERGISIAAPQRRPPATGFSRVERDLPASGNFAVITGLQAKMYGDEFPAVGHMLRAPNDKRITQEYIAVNGFPKIEHNNWSSDSGFVVAKISKQSYMMTGGIWFRLEYVNGQVTSFISADGVEWMRYFQNDTYFDQRPTKYGLFIKPSGGSGSEPLYIKALFYHSEIIAL